MINTKICNTQTTRQQQQTIRINNENNFAEEKIARKKEIIEKLIKTDKDGNND